MIHDDKDNNFIQELKLFLFMIIFLLGIFSSTDITGGGQKFKTSIVYERTFNDIWYEYIDSIYNAIDGRKYPYICPAGYPTVGIGHKIEHNDSFKYPLSDSTIYQLLVNDMNNKKKAVLKIHPNLTGYKLIAITDLVASIGQGRYRVSKLRLAVGNEIDIKKYILSFAFYKDAMNNLIFSQHILDKRIRQYQVYNKQRKKKIIMKPISYEVFVDINNSTDEKSSDQDIEYDYREYTKLFYKAIEDADSL